MMQLTEKRKRVQPLWVVVLLIPMLVSCAVPIVIWEVVLYLGANLIYTGTGQFIEQVVDNLVDQMFHADSPGYVIPDRDDPLQGTYSKKMKFTTTNPGGQRKSFEINQPRMVKNSTSSTWTLAPDLRGLVDQILEAGA